MDSPGTPCHSSPARTRTPAPLRIATWNVNSVRQRLDHLLTWLRETAPDVVCLQEIKCQEEAFPRAEIEALGYGVEVVGQKGFNGVAILSRRPFETARRALPGDPGDEQARYLEIVVPTAGGPPVRIASIYLPNGNPAGTEKYPYKLAWMERLTQHARALLALEEPLVLAGDYNVIPDDRDAYDPAAWVGDALTLPATREAFRALIALGLSDALRLTSDEAALYTFWEYQAGAWNRNHGVRIDHLLLSPQAANRLVSCRIDQQLRALDKPSDHVPVSVELRFEEPAAA